MIIETEKIVHLLFQKLLSLQNEINMFFDVILRLIIRSTVKLCELAPCKYTKIAFMHFYYFCFVSN